MTLWGGRFEEKPAEILWSYSASSTDRRMLGDDLLGSVAHTEMLKATGILPPAECDLMLEGLASIIEEASGGEFAFADRDEDVHSAVERRLIELIGEVGAKLHTGRSRNDQVALDLRLYLRRAAGDRVEQLAGFALALAGVAEAQGETVVASYTHLQQAQAVPLAHHLLAYAWMAVRDRERFADLGRRLDVSPLGAGAGGGSSLPLDPQLVASLLEFESVSRNSLDAVASRDLVSEYAFCCAQAMVHASRLAEEITLWAGEEFGWLSFPDSLATGSSALPHKKNPDIAELARGRSAGAIGELTSLLVLQKGLPLSYNRDLQEDKEHVFRADDTLTRTLEALTAVVQGVEFHPPGPSSWVTALDLAEALVERGVAFREAHQLVGRVVSSLAAAGRDLASATISDLRAIDDHFESADLERIDPEQSVRRRQSLGGGSFKSVGRQIEELLDLLG